MKVLAGSHEGRVAFYRAQDGLRLAARAFDAPAGPTPLLCLPGLSHNSRDFLGLARFFAGHASQARKVVALDYRGRGLSEPSPDWRTYTPLQEAQDTLAAAAAFGLERVIVVGTSRGGIIAMLLGALRPTLLAGVVLNDIGPVIEGVGLARIKTHLSANRPLADWTAAVAALRGTAGAQFPALADDDWRAWAEAILAPTERGLEPQFDRKLLRIFDAVDFGDKAPALWPQFASLAGIPVLAIRGEHSDLFSPRTLAEMAGRHPDFETLTVRGQGHAPLLRDAQTLERILGFADRCDRRA